MVSEEERDKGYFWTNSKLNKFHKNVFFYLISLFFFLNIEKEESKILYLHEKCHMLVKIGENQPWTVCYMAEPMLMKQCVLDANAV